MDRFLEVIYYYTLLARGSDSIYALITSNNESRLYNNRAITTPVSPYIVYRNTETEMVRTMSGDLLYNSKVLFTIYTNDHQSSILGNRIQSNLVYLYKQGEIPEYNGIIVQQMNLVEAGTNDDEDYFCHHALFNFLWVDVRG